MEKLSKTPGPFKFSLLYRAWVEDFGVNPKGCYETVYFPASTPEHAMAQVRELFPAGQLRSLTLADGELALREPTNE